MRRSLRSTPVIAALAACFAACLAACVADSGGNAGQPPGPSSAAGTSPSSASQPAGASDSTRWALAIQAGAGVISRTVDESNRDEYLESLRQALKIGSRILSEGGTSLDAVEQILVFIENDPKFNAGKGAVYNHDGNHELDASIMDGRTHACGAVAGVTTVKNPISLARRVMERTRHVLLAGAGAERFADETGVERVTQDYFHTERRYRQWQERLKGARGTAGAVALDRHGNLAAGTSTGGLTDKRFGRIGDSPIIGAGTYADNATCAVTGTGVGEEYIRYAVAHRISALMAYRGLSLQDAAEEVIMRTLKPGDGGIAGVDHSGAIALVFNTEGMFRGAADSNGRFEVAIWE